MLKRMILDQSKQGCKFPYSMEAIGFCIHNTDNSAPAINERNNLNRADNNAEVSFHVVTDENESIQCIEFNRNAWASGDGGQGTGNRKYIHWEIARSHNSDSSLFAAAQERAAKDLAEELKKRGWGIDRIKTHRDFSNKNCPSRTDISKFKAKVQAYLDNGNINIPSTNPDINSNINVGDKVQAFGKTYATGQVIPDWVKKNIYTVTNISGNKVLLSDINSWVYSGEVRKIEASKPPVTPTPPQPTGRKKTILSINGCNEWVTRLQKELNAQGFRDYNGSTLVTNGYTGKCTLSACERTPLKYGSKGNITKLVQEMLNKLGYNTNGIDGSFGPGMKSAVEQYQRDWGLTVDGSFGPQCYKLILGM